MALQNVYGRHPCEFCKRPISTSARGFQRHMATHRICGCAHPLSMHADGGTRCTLCRCTSFNEAGQK